MGFWDRQVTRFYAMGIEIDPADLEVMEQGGEVVHLHHLLAPEWAGGYRYQRAHDQNGDAVWAPEILKVAGLTDNLIAYFETEYGETWRSYPSFIGSVDYHYVAEDRTMSHRTDGWSAFRFWNCNSFPDRSVVEEMCEASDRRLKSTLHYQLADVFDYEENKDHAIDLGVLWAFDNDKSRLTTGDWQDIERWMQRDLNPETAEEEMSQLQQALESYQLCLAAGLMLPANPTGEEADRLKPLFYPPMSDFLTPGLNRQWEAMIGRRDYIVFAVTEHMDNAQKYRFAREEEDE